MAIPPDGARLLNAAGDRILRSGGKAALGDGSRATCCCDDGVPCYELRLCSDGTPTGVWRRVADVTLPHYEFAGTCFSIPLGAVASNRADWGVVGTAYASCAACEAAEDCSLCQPGTTHYQYWVTLTNVALTTACLIDPGNSYSLVVLGGANVGVGNLLSGTWLVTRIPGDRCRWEYVENGPPWSLDVEKYSGPGCSGTLFSAKQFKVVLTRTGSGPSIRWRLGVYATDAPDNVYCAEFGGDFDADPCDAPHSGVPNVLVAWSALNTVSECQTAGAVTLGKNGTAAIAPV